MLGAEAGIDGLVRQQVLPHELQPEHDNIQEGLQSSSSTAPGLSDAAPSPSVPLHNLQGNDAGFDADLDTIPPPPELEDLSIQLDRGLPTFNIDGSRTRQVFKFAETT